MECLRLVKPRIPDFRSLRVYLRAVREAQFKTNRVSMVVADWYGCDLPAMIAK